MVNTILKDELFDILAALKLTADQTAGPAPDFLRGYHTALASVAAAIGARPAGVPDQSLKDCSPHRPQKPVRKRREDFGELSRADKREVGK